MFNENEKLNTLADKENTNTKCDNNTSDVLSFQSHDNTDAQVNAKQKTFTQNEVDEIVKKRLSRALKLYPDKEELLELKQIKEESLGKDKIISDLQSAADLNAQRLATYELKEKIIKNGVDLKFADFALFEIKRGIDAGLDFDSSFESFIENNDFLVKKFETTGLRQGGSIAPGNSVEESFYKINPNLKKGGF